MSNLLTASRMKCYRECRRKHKLMYLDGWRPVKEADALRFGSLMHEGLEAWWSTRSLAATLGAVDARGIDDFEQAKAEELLRGYHTRWIGTADYHTVTVEESFYAPLVNPDTMASSRTWKLGGKVDAIAVKDGRPVLIEHKTTSESVKPESDYWAKLCMDYQISHYHIGAEALGHEVEACIYDVIHKPTIRPWKATPEDKRKYKQDGTLYANLRECDETAGEYGVRLAADIKANPDAYYQRREIVRTERDMREYLADLWATAKTMREEELADRAPRNPDACHRFGTCWAWDHCAFGLQLEDYPERFTQSSNVHPELEEKEVTSHEQDESQEREIQPRRSAG